MTDDLDTESWPVFLNKGTYFIVPNTGDVPPGRMVGSILFEHDAFTAWRYISKGPQNLGSAPTWQEAIALFYRRKPIPNPPDGWLRRRVKIGRPQWEPSVRYWGS